MDVVVLKQIAMWAREMTFMQALHSPLLRKIASTHRHQALSFRRGVVYRGRENYAWKTASHFGSPEVEWTLIWVNFRLQTSARF